MKNQKNPKVNIHAYDSWPPKNEHTEKSPKKNDKPRNVNYIDLTEDLKNTDAPVYDIEEEKKEIEEEQNG